MLKSDLTVSKKQSLALRLFLNAFQVALVAFYATRRLHFLFHLMSVGCEYHGRRQLAISLNFLFLCLCLLIDHFYFLFGYADAAALAHRQVAQFY